MIGPPWARDRVLRTLFLLALITVPLYALDVLPGAVYVGAAWLIMLGMQLTAGTLAVAVVRLPGQPASSRRFWRLVAGTALCFAVSSVVQLTSALRDPHAPAAVIGTTAHTAILTAGVFCLIVAMLTAPLGLSSARERFRFWLDAVTIMIAVAIFAWQISGVEDVVQSRGSAAEGLANALVGPAAFLVVAFGVLKLMLGGAAPFTRDTAALGAAAAAIWGIAEGLSGQLIAADRAALLLGIDILSTVAFAAGLRMHLVETRQDAEATQRADRRPYSRLPYAAIAATYALLMWILSDAGLTVRAWVVLCGAVASTTLVVIRQLAALADNAQLLARLDAKVRELAEAQDVLHRAIDERDTLAAQLRHLAFHDSLTGLANRALFLNRLNEALDAARRTGDAVGLIIIDLDDFKPVNDRHGHAAGDALLREVALRLVKSVSDAGLVARLGGDEFGVVLDRPAVEIGPMVHRIGASLRRPVRLRAAQAVVGASIGTAVEDGSGGADAATLMHRADLAMYAVKQRTKHDRLAPGVGEVA